MGAFLANLNFPRAVILFSALASLALGWFGWRMSAKEALLGEQATHEVKGLVQEIQVLSLQLNQLNSQADKEGLGIQDDPEFYIRQIAQQDGVNIGQVTIDRPPPQQPYPGVIDVRFVVKPSDSQGWFHRTLIANFLYRLEEKSRRVRVTHLRIEPKGKFKPHEIGPDRWTFDAQITARQPKE